MRYAKQLVAVLLGVAVLACACGPAVAGPTGPCGIKQARADSKKAHKRYLVAKRKYCEARRVYRETRRYAGCYGISVARWTRPARRAGYRWAELPTLMSVIDRESGGDPAIPNRGGSGALGLLQVMPEWANGSKVWYWDRWNLPARWDRTNPWETLRHCVHMSWSNWGE